MNRVLFGIWAAVGGVAIAGSAQAAVTTLLQDNFEGTIGDSLANSGWTKEYNPLGGATGVISGTTVDTGNSALLSGSGASWSQNFAAPYVVQSGDVVTAQVYVTFPNGSPAASDGSGMRVDQVHLLLRGKDANNVGRSYELVAYDYGYVLSNDSTGGAYAIDGGIYGYGTVQKWLKMVYDNDTHTLTNYTAPANDPTNWRLFSTNSNLTMQSFTGIALVGGAYSDGGTTQYADSLSVTVNSVPEPAAIGLVGISALSLLRWRRRA